jgi:hypothetical protein
MITMASSHAHRDHTGRFVPAPVPPATTPIESVSGDPQGEHGKPGTHTGYPEHAPAHGPVQRLIPQRTQRVINATTGEEVSRHAFDVRAVQTRPGGRTTTHVVETDGEPFLGETAQADTMRGYRHTPGTGYRLPSMYEYPDYPQD